MKEKSSLESAAREWQTAFQEVEDLKVLYELGIEEDDESVLAEVEERYPGLLAAVKDLELQRMLDGLHDKNNAILAINSGAGGTEAQDWAEMLLRMYMRWCERRKFQVEILDEQAGEEAGLKNVTILVKGHYAYGHLRAEIGVHRLVRISPFDANKKRHTSFASVFVYPEIEDDIEVEVHNEDIRIDTYRASGAGGQHVNKTDSAVRITHAPSGIVVQCQNDRSQHKNKATAMKILRARLYEHELQEKQKEMDKLSAEKKQIAWGNQIRSYVMAPYQMVKDHRTNMEIGNVDAVMDGELDGLIEKYLLQESS